MKPSDIQVLGDELAIKWEDGNESYIKLATLRHACPCAGCKGETDIMGNRYKNPDTPLSESAFQLERVINVGGYAIQPYWADGHATGIYTYAYLQQLAAATA